MTLDIIFDAIGMIGLVMLGYGLYLVSPVYMFTIIGTLFIIFAVVASRGLVKIVPYKKKAR